MKRLIKEFKRRSKGFVLIAMLVIPFFLYAAAKSDSTWQVNVYLFLMAMNMAVAMRIA